MLKEVNEGHWFYPVQTNIEETYNVAYIAKYEGYANTELGRNITQRREEFVDKLVPESFKTVDVGVGSGDFMRKHNCLGYDVNPSMVKCLTEEGRFVDIYNQEEMEEEDVRCLTFFDSFEHIEDPSRVLRQLPLGSFVVISIPIFKNTGKYVDYPVKPVQEWKHYREDEHYHYFTGKAFLLYMANLGFNLQDYSDFESVLGREDIITFGFVKGE